MSIQDKYLIQLRYEAYKGALAILASDYQSVAERKSAIHVRDEFELDLRKGEFEIAFMLQEQIIK